ncbi:hypothetical protein BJ165DRAFT_423534 [Panaeolus papilionaceus]|nr:hypothetical protein BJ165DRAFT_423534 [Panaeolus papilionaceus]
MKRREHHRTSNSQLVDEKDHQIVQLKLALQTQITRNSLIHSRLLATLDSLDLQQLTHHDEVMELKKARDLLKARLARYIGVVETTEAEKNDMRDAVLQLVQRGKYLVCQSGVALNYIFYSGECKELRSIAL